MTNLVLDFGNNNIVGEWIGNKLATLNNLVDLSLYLNDNSVDNNAFESMLSNLEEVNAGEIKLNVKNNNIA